MIMGNCAQFLVLQGLPGGDTGIINIYAPNESDLRIQLWGEILLSLPSGCCRIILSDFNFVERRQDKTNACDRLVPMIERMVFEALKAFLQIDEPSRSLDNLKFSWDNYRLDGLRVLARLDRFYVLQSTAIANRKIVSYKIKGDVGWSDHSPIELSVQLELGFT